jgi:hypothetical protein
MIDGAEELQGQNYPPNPIIIVEARLLLKKLSRD